MSDERTAELFELLGRIDERTQKTSEDVEHLMRIVALGNGKPALTVQVEDLEGRVSAVELDKRSKTAVKVGIFAMVGSFAVVIGGILDKLFDLF